MLLKKVLIVDDVHQSLVHGLIEANFDVHYRPDLQGNEIVNYIQSIGFEGLIIRSKLYLNESFFNQCGTIEWIARAGAGMDNIDEIAAQNAGVFLMNSENANSDAVGEQTISMLLAIQTNLIKSHNEVVQFQWDREGNRGFELKGKTVGIIGYGNTGMAVAQKLSGFGVEILAYDKYKSKFSDNNVTEVDLAELMNKSDVISLHVPLTKQTENLVDENFINGVKKPFVLLNLSRGKIVDIQSVVVFLGTGKLIGYAADVLPVEPPSKGNENERNLVQKLFDFKNVVLSPHVGGWTIESYEKISQFLLVKILNYNNMV